MYEEVLVGNETDHTYQKLYVSRPQKAIHNLVYDTYTLCLDMYETSDDEEIVMVRVVE